MDNYILRDIKRNNLREKLKDKVTTFLKDACDFAFLINFKLKENFDIFEDEKEELLKLFRDFDFEIYKSKTKEKINTIFNNIKDNYKIAQRRKKEFRLCIDQLEFASLYRFNIIETLIKPLIDFLHLEYQIDIKMKLDYPR